MNNYLEQTIPFAQTAVYRCRQVRGILTAVLEEGADPVAYCKENGLDSKADEGAIEAVIDKVIAENPKAVEDFKDGKVKAKQALFGACMRELNGTANTDVIR